MKRGVCSISLAAALTLAARANAASPFYMGSDISLLTFMQQQKVVFKTDGVAEPADQILYNMGDNLFRLRIFVNPQTTYTNTNVGAIQTTAYDIALAQQLKADDPGAQLLLDFHYSDTWADPGHQTIPAAWAGETLSQLETTIQTYTDTTLTAFGNAGVMPNMVQVGNEINNGMLWPTGELNFSGTTAQQDASWEALGGLLNSAIAGVREAQGSGPKIQVAIHIANGATDGEPQYYFNNIQTIGGVSDFDIMGFSFYPSSSATLATLQSNLTAVANSYPTKKIMILETNYPYSSNSSYSGWAETQAGQEQEIAAVSNVLLGLPHDAGEGLVYWYPESVQVPGYNIYNGGDTALFDKNGNALPALSAFNITLPAGTWILPIGGTWNSTASWSSGSIPEAAGATVNFTGDITTASTVTLDAAWMAGAVTFDNTNSYTLAAGTGGTLTLDNGGASATATITDAGGTHTISAPLQLNSNLSVTVSNAGDTLKIAGPVSGNGKALTVSGNGIVSLSSPIAISSLTINAGATLDMTGSTVTINYGANSDPASTIRGYLVSGRGNGNWQGTGLTSSLAAANPSSFTLGYADGGNAADAANAGVAPGTVEVEYTVAGDANLSGGVDLSDLVIVASDFGQTGADWAQGDVNYDGNVDLSDLVIVASNFGASLSSVQSSDFTNSFAAEWQLALAEVHGADVSMPEPGAVVLAAIAAAGWSAGRRRASR
jgi:arabinogalactan endo-1,4-beta-galactosidase